MYLFSRGTIIAQNKIMNNIFGQMRFFNEHAMFSIFMFCFGNFIQQDMQGFQGFHKNQTFPSWSFAQMMIVAIILCQVPFQKSNYGTETKEVGPFMNLLYHIYSIFFFQQDMLTPSPIFLIIKNYCTNRDYSLCFSSNSLPKINACDWDKGSWIYGYIFAFSFCIFFNKTHLNIWHMHF